VSGALPAGGREALDERQRQVALLAAVALFLATVEHVIPKPVPFLKLGLANLPVLVALTVLRPREIFTLVTLKIAGQGLVQGTLFSYIVLFSTAGSLASAATMLLLHRGLGRHVSLVGISIMGALASNLAQIASARLLIFGESAWLIAPAFLITGTVSALLLGLFAERFVRRSRWLRALPPLANGATGPSLAG
jgi:heptaprenyl diphosphate synthase